VCGSTHAVPHLPVKRKRFQEPMLNKHYLLQCFNYKTGVACTIHGTPHSVFFAKVKEEYCSLSIFLGGKGVDL